MIVIGIDPGLAGGVVALDQDSRVVLARRTPLITGAGSKAQYDERAMRELLAASRPPGEARHVAIEQVGAMPGQGVTSMFRFGYGCGLWRGIAVGLGLPIHDVRPQAWAQLLDGLPRGEAMKSSAVLRARALWPDLPIEKKVEWCFADAALIAEVVRRRIVGADAAAASA